MPDPLTDAGLRQCAERLINVLRDRHYGRMPDDVQDAFDNLVAALAAVDQLQPAAAERDAIATLLSDRSEAGTYAKVEGLLERAEAAEARLQSLQPYVQHKADCDYMQVHYGFNGQTILAWPHDKPCTCGLATLTQPGARQDDALLFKPGDFALHSGERASVKIDCDQLNAVDYVALSKLLHDRVGAFSRVEGVPRGGVAWADVLNAGFCSKEGALLIVDDVLTTGASMEQQRAGREAIGAVIFARGPVPSWVTPLWSLTQPGAAGQEKV